MTYPMLGRQKRSLFPCSQRFTCPPSSGAASSSSVRAQSKSLVGLPDHLAKAAQTPLGFGPRASQLLFYSAIALQCNLLPPEIGSVNQNEKKKEKKSKGYQTASTQQQVLQQPNWHHFLFGMHRAGPGQLNLSFYRNTMRNMQQQRQYIINLIVSWAFWDIQDERLNNLQSFVEQQ